MAKQKVKIMTKLIAPVLDNNNQVINTIKSSEAEVTVGKNTASFVFFGDITVTVDVKADISKSNLNKHNYFTHYTNYEYELTNIKVTRVQVEDENCNESYPIFNPELIANLIVDWIDEIGEKQQVYTNLSLVHEERYEAQYESLYPYESRGLSKSDFL